MNRFPDWPERLQRFLERRQEQRFKWGVQDCALFACDAVVEMTGVDLAADFRGQYSTAHSARRAIKIFAHGGLADVAEKVAGKHHIAEVEVALAQRGDIALVEMEEGDPFPYALVVVMIGHLVGPAHRGVERLPLSRIRRVWAIGREV